MNNLKYEFRSKNLNQFEKISKKIFLEFYKDKKIFFISGEVGSGKTTMIKKWAKFLKEKEIVTSPSFLLRHEYKKFIHYDFYFKKKIDENLNQKINEESENWFIFIEWPLIKKTLQKNELFIEIKVLNEEERIVKVW